MNNEKYKDAIDDIFSTVNTLVDAGFTRSEAIQLIPYVHYTSSNRRGLEMGGITINDIGHRR